jgi:ElaB/YqjD/DUF883 family membrane-anchored ribosome-binding protein
MGLRNVITGQPNVQKELDTVRRDLSRLRTDVGDVVSAVGDLGRQNVGQVRSGVNEQIEALNKRYAIGRKACRRQWRQMRRSASEHPYGTTLIALAVGFTLAAIVNAFWFARR